MRRTPLRSCVWRVTHGCPFAVLKFNRFVVRPSAREGHFSSHSVARNPEKF
jgi:hypothetical protein